MSLLLTQIPTILMDDCRMIKAVYDQGRQLGNRLDGNQALLVGLAIGRILLTASALLVLGKKGIKMTTVGYALLAYDLFGLSYNQTMRMGSSSSLSSIFSSVFNQGKGLAQWGLGAIKQAAGAEKADPIHPIAQGTLAAPLWSALANTCKIPLVWTPFQS